MSADAPPLPHNFACPRCQADVTQEFYGPCDDCRTQLRATMGGGETEVAEVAYEPKMNVTPNAVATKE